MSTVRQYELIYITPPEATEEALAELHQQVTAVTDRFGATIEKTENWGRRKLAYEIAGHREGVYVLEVINGPAPMVAELDRRLRVFDNVIRHLVVRVDEELAVAERAKTRRKDRDGQAPRASRSAARADRDRAASAGRGRRGRRWRRRQLPPRR